MSTSITLDVIIPTYNRANLLERTLQSLFAADVPPQLAVTIVVVDNNSQDTTRQTVEAWTPIYHGRMRYVFEPRQGRSYALNTGVASSDSQLIGFIDDDEEVEAGWFRCISAAFASDTLDFIGGPYVPNWGASIPSWFPDDYRGVVGWVDSGQHVRPYDESFDGILMGGNAVIRRSTLVKVGPFDTALGRTSKGLLSCDDEEMYWRLRAAGARGLYCPDLVIRHYVPPERLTKKYFRRWCFWQGASQGILDRRTRADVPYFGAIPRWLYGRVARNALRLAARPLSHTAAVRFSSQLPFWHLAGFIYGKCFLAPKSTRRTEVPFSSPAAAIRNTSNYPGSSQRQRGS
jgi:glycosyltransferase involved in cell wall biosynthesis